jgi:transcriptional regulator with XRE-family HTH domain
MNTINKKCHINVDCNVEQSYATFDVAMAGKKANDNWVRFGHWVQQKRDALGMRQEDLGDKIGKDRQTIYRIEKGRSTKRPTVILIAVALGEKPQTAVDMAFGVPTEESQSSSTTSTSSDVESASRLAWLYSQLPEARQKDALAVIETLYHRHASGTKGANLDADRKQTVHNSGGLKKPVTRERLNEAFDVAHGREGKPATPEDKEAMERSLVENGDIEVIEEEDDDKTPKK